MKNIMIIEDEEIIRENLKELLEIYGYHTQLATNGADGLLLIKEVKPDLILCDVMMPGIDGFELKRIIEMDSQFSHIPFLFLTAKVDLENIRKGMNLGADDYITKPFKKEELIQSIVLRLKKHEKLINRFDRSIESDIISSKILLKFGHISRLIDKKDIVLIETNGNYTNIVLQNYPKTICRKLIKEWEIILDKNMFIRVNQSVIININCVELIEKVSNRNYFIKLFDIKKTVKISQRYLSLVLKRFK